MTAAPGAGAPLGAITTGSITCGTAREFLARLDAGEPVPAAPAVWGELAPRNVVGGTPARPELTATGRKVLHELTVRAGRVDPRPLDEVASEIGIAVGVLARRGVSAAYFLAELGPVPPVDVLPLLRIVAVGLACLPESPESLVEQFENAWGAMEVLGRVATDRLLAAELLAGSGVAEDTFYAPMTSTAERLSSIGCAEPLSVAVLLHLRASPGTPAALVEAWRSARAQCGSDLEAGLIADSPDPTDALRRRDGWRSLVSGSETDRRRAATYLAARGEPSESEAARIRAITERLGREFPHPALAAAIAGTFVPYDAEEVVDWVAKAVDAATASQLAPRRAELEVLGLGLVRDLVGPARPGFASTAAGAAEARVALHAWMFRETVRPSGRA